MNLLRMAHLTGIILPMKQLISSSIAVIFVVLTTQLIFYKPLALSPSNNKRTRTLDNDAILFQRLSRNTKLTPDNKTELPKLDKYVVFDAQGRSTDLGFLNTTPSDWTIIVINFYKDAISSCANCHLMRKSWVTANVLNKVPAATQGVLEYPTLEKMAAYLYVLNQGAEWIYTTNLAEPIPYRSLQLVTNHKVRTAPVFQGPGEVFEPCSHFMDPITWAGRSAVGTVSRRYNVKVVSTDSVHQVVRNCFSPGMDFHSLQKAFDDQAPPPYMMPGTFAAVDFHNVLVSKTSAWVLVASLAKQSPPSTISPHSAVRLNMMVQRLMWDTSSLIGFIPDTPTEKACPSCLLNDSVHAHGRGYIEQLTRWRCDTFETVLKCLVKMAFDDAINGNKDVTGSLIVSSWAKLLSPMTAPQRVSMTDEKLKDKYVGIPVIYSASKTMHTSTSNDSMPPNLFLDLCQSKDSKYIAKIPEKHPITDILLIVVFNFPDLVRHIPYLEYIYGRHFKHMLYCGESLGEFHKLYQDPNFKMSPVSFVEIPHYRGYWGQNCMSAAIKMNYGVMGYLQISDDVLLNVWNLYKLPRHSPWFQSSLRVAHIDHTILPDIWINKFWWPWSQFSGQKAAARAFKHLNFLRSHAEMGERVSLFMENLYNITNCDRCFLYEASDIFYLPQHLGNNYTFFSDLLAQNQVFLEVSIPTVLVGITSDHQVYRLRGNYLWFQDRKKYPFVYTKFDHFYHAWKLSNFKDPQEVKFYCSEFLARLDRDVMAAGLNGD